MTSDEFEESLEAIEVIDGVKALTRFEAARQSALLLEAKRSGLDPRTMPAFQRKASRGDKIQDVFDEGFRLWCEDRREEKLDYIMGRIKLCESPIEQQLLIALFFVTPYFCESICIPHNESFATNAHQMYPLDGFIAVRPQAQIGQYRVDFLITVKYDGEHEPADVLVVECDGHDYHERTKDQAARDKSRDRYLTAQGLQIMRFTGREIHRDAHNCAQEIMDCLFKQWEREGKRR